MAAADVQAALRRAFCRWGCPAALRVDNGYPWGAVGGLATGLALWLAGLGVTVRYNPPRRPWRNGVVESSQRVTQRWAGVDDCPDLEELRRRVAREDVVQRQEYPAIDGKSRMRAYPGLIHTGRGYCRGFEEFAWDLGEALAYLGQRAVRRKVGRQGKVSLYDRMVMVGAEYAGQVMQVRLDPGGGPEPGPAWVITDAAGREARRRPALGLSREAIQALNVSRG